MVKVYNGKTEPLTERTAFEIKTLNLSTLPLPDQEKMKEFNKDLSELRRVVLGTEHYYGNLKERIKYLRRGITNGHVNVLELLSDLAVFDKKRKDLDLKLNGDESLAKREFETLPGFVGSLENIVGSSWSQSLGATQTHQEKLNLLRTEFKTIYQSVIELKSLVESMESKAESMKMPATPGRFPVWGK